MDNKYRRRLCAMQSTIWTPGIRKAAFSCITIIILFARSFYQFCIFFIENNSGGMGGGGITDVLPKDLRSHADAFVVMRKD